MDLRNTLKHKANTKVLVDGVVYDIDAEGIVRDLPDEAAEKLLQNNVWTKDIEGPQKPVRAPVKRAMLLTDDETPVPGQKALVEDKEVAKAVEEHEEEFLEEEEAEAPEEEEEEDSEEDWPEPSEDMDIEYLRQMAEAYEVTYNGRTGAATLVKRLKEAMYE